MQLMTYCNSVWTVVSHCICWVIKIAILFYSSVEFFERMWAVDINVYWRKKLAANNRFELSYRTLCIVRVIIKLDIFLFTSFSSVMMSILFNAHLRKQFYYGKPFIWSNESVLFVCKLFVLILRIVYVAFVLLK